MKTLFPLWCRSALLATFLMLLGFQTQASHYRYGNISWQDLGNNTIQFKVTQAWRTGFFFGGSAPAVGSTVTTGSLNFGDFTSSNIVLTVTSVDPTPTVSSGWFFGEATITHTYSNPGNYTASFGSCCRIGGMQNNSNGSFNSTTTVNVGTGNNSPVTTITPIVNLQANVGNATFSVPANDPDGDPLTFSDGGLIIIGSNHPRTSIGSNGTITFDTDGTFVGQLYNVLVAISDGNSTVTVDFLVRIVQQSNPPQWDYSVTPFDGTVFQVPPGTPLNFDVKAFDNDPGSTVTVNGVGVPLGASFASSTGNPTTSPFSWTPTSSDLGTNVINFTATDDNGVQINTSVSIVVSLAPQFDIPPTPATAVHNVVAPGNTLTFTAQASDPDPNDVVQIVSAKHKMTGLDFVTNYGATLTPALPTPAANPTSTVFSWTPMPSQWGHNHVIFRAVDSFGDDAEHEVAILVNTDPVFTSVPVTSATVGVPYVYNIVANDPDIPFGDILTMYQIGALPAWLMFTDNGGGSATLSGTPGPGDVGVTPMITLEAQDINHHHAVGGIPNQMFTITVSQSAGCTNPADPTNLTVSKDTAFVANLNWDDNSNNEEGFVVYRSSTSGGVEILDTTDANATSYTDMFVPYFDENVDYYVVAIEDNCESNPSNTDYFFQPRDLNRLRLRYVCYDSNSDSLTWKIQNSGNYYRPVIWAQWWSTQQDTVWAAPNGDSYFKTKNNPQSGSTWGDDNITGIYYWVSYYVMKDHTRTNIPLSNSCSSARFEASHRAGQAHLGAGGPALEIRNVRDMGDELLRQSLTVAPNPSSSRVWITPIEAMDQEASYTLMDAMGRSFVVGEGNLLESMEINMSELAAGVYMLRIESGGLSTTHRVIKR